MQFLNWDLKIQPAEEKVWIIKPNKIVSVELSENDFYVKN